MENNNIVMELKNRALERVKAYQEEIRQNEMFVKCCDDTTKSIADSSIFKKIKYNALNAKNAAENPDVAPVDDKERAENSIKDASVQLMSYKKNLEIILGNLEEVNINSLIDEVSELRKFVSLNKDLDDRWLDYSQDVLNGNYYEFNESEVVELENKEEETIKNEVPLEENEEVVEDEIIEETAPLEEEVDKVVAVEPFEKKEETDFDKLSQELDDELDKALKPIQEDISSIKNELDSETAPIESQEVTDINNVTEPADFFSFNTEVDKKEENTVEEEITSAPSVDEGAVKVVKIEEVGAPEQTQDEEYTRRLA